MLRPDPPPIFTAEPNLVEAAVLQQWGVTVLSGEGGNAGQALLNFLRRAKYALPGSAL